jgi:hypothetical protein
MVNKFWLMVTEVWQMATDVHTKCGLKLSPQVNSVRSVLGPLGY